MSQHDQLASSSSSNLQTSPEVNLRPLPAFNVGITGHRKLLPSQELEATTIKVFQSLYEAMRTVVKRNAGFFQASGPKLRIISMAAQGADLFGIEAAVKCGYEVACILPYFREAYGKDFDQVNLSNMERIAASASTVLELAGTRDEGARAYERANDVILENIDILVAFWDGERARGRAGTAEVVQRAVSMNLFVIVIDPADPTHARLLEAPNDRNLAPLRATDLMRKDLSSDLTDLVSATIDAPNDQASRQAFLDLLAEKQKSFQWRFEHRLLLRVLASTDHEESKEKSHSSDFMFTGIDRNAPALEEIRRQQGFIDQVAVQYGQLFRSSSASRYLLVIFGTFAASMVSLLFPRLSGSAIAVQAVVNGIVLVDSAIGSLHRWQERWLEYRVIAQRLRWISVLRPFGFGTGQPVRERHGMNDSWATWYITRLAAGFGPPSGKITEGYLSSAASALQGYAHQQLTYHRSKLHQLGLLENRLRALSVMALIGAVLIAASLAISVELYNGLVSWKPAAIVLLTILPATMTALNGLRAEMDLVRMIERSAQTSVLLSKINRAISDGPLTFDRLSVGAHRLTSIMDDELREWRFVLESRRARTGLRRPPLGWLWRAFAGPPAAR